jgi:hypothetical protein
MNTYYTFDLPEIRNIFQLHYGTVSLSPASIGTLGALCRVCRLPENVAITLYTGKGSDVSGDCAISIKTENETVDCVV